MRGEWNTQYIAVSPIRGGSLPSTFRASGSIVGFPHTRGKLNVKLNVKMIPHVLGKFAILKAIVFLNLFHHPVP